MRKWQISICVWGLPNTTGKLKLRPKVVFILVTEVVSHVWWNILRTKVFGSSVTHIFKAINGIWKKNVFGWWHLYNTLKEGRICLRGYFQASICLSFLLVSAHFSLHCLLCSSHMKFLLFIHICHSVSHL